MPDGRAVEAITLRDGPYTCTILTLGGIVQSLIVPDRAGKAVDIALGMETARDYLSQDKYLGALVGRCANRTAGASFVLNGEEYPLRANDGPNHLHGGGVGFDKKLWTVEELTGNTLNLSLISPDGEEGYPGALTVEVTYRLWGGCLEIGYLARSDKNTVCNLTNHTYFNLSGHGAGSVENHLLKLNASRYTPIGPGSIPTGEIAPVEGTPMDLRVPTRLGDGWDRDFEQLRLAGGYDHNWVIDGEPGVLRPFARAYAPDTGIMLELEATLPGVQLYTGNFLEGCPPGKGGAVYGRRAGFCLETQFYPDSLHHPQFPSPILRAGEIWRHTARFRFGTEG
ncbi:MAG: galactose mutarotase [Oscillospiraceae bacterium]|nr:galactose mutarotase [Oscillospiraceae bacterium]